MFKERYEHIFVNEIKLRKINKINTRKSTPARRFKHCKFKLINFNIYYLTIKIRNTIYTKSTILYYFGITNVSIENIL